MIEAATASLVLMVCLLAGLALVPRCWGNGNGLWLWALRLGSGLLAWAGLAGSFFSGRFCYATLIPLLQVVAVWGWRRWGRGDRLREGRLVRESSLALVMLVSWVVCVLGVGWQFEWRMPGGGLRAFHSDLGYHAQLAIGMPEAAASSHWAATLGAAAVEGSATRDVWYHWAPVWLAAAVAQLSGVSEMVALYHVIAPVFVFELLLLAAAILRTLARGWSAWALMLGGAASILAVQWIRMFGILWLGPVLPFGTVQHTRLSLVGHFPYQFEGIVIFLSLAAWLNDRRWLAALFVLIAGVSSPHNVAVLGVSAGALLGLGILVRRRDLWQPALVMVALLLGAWGLLRWGFGVDLPKAADQSILSWDWKLLLVRFRSGVLDAGLGLVFHLLLLPGLIFLIRAQDTPATHRLLGWLGISAWLGSYLAFHLLRHVSDGFHFTMLAHAALVMPISVWGWLSAAANAGRLWRWLGLGLVVLCTAMGLHDVWHARERLTALPYAGDDLRALRMSLRGEPFGYFAQTDRQWWISKHCTLASLLDARCVRLRPIASMDGDPYSRYYGASRPQELVPSREGETTAEWSLRFARRLGIRFVLETEADPLPEALKAGAKLLHGGKTLRLYELLTAPSASP